MLVERGFMGRRKTSIISEGDGLIRSIKWCQDLIAWSDHKGVKIYSITEKRVITFVTKDHDSTFLRDELFRCCLLWTDADTLIIGWTDRFKICKVVRRSFGNLPTNTKASGNFVTISDKKDMGTHVEISKKKFYDEILLSLVLSQDITLRCKLIIKWCNRTIITFYCLISC